MKSEDITCNDTAPCTVARNGGAVVTQSQNCTFREGRGRLDCQSRLPASKSFGILSRTQTRDPRPCASISDSIVRSHLSAFANQSKALESTAVGGYPYLTESM